MKTKFFSIGAGVLTALAVLYAGNVTMNTTPQSEAGGEYQYKVVNVQDIAMKMMGGEGSETMLETRINEYSQQGWEYVELIDGGFIVFRK